MPLNHACYAVISLSAQDGRDPKIHGRFLVKSEMEICRRIFGRIRDPPGNKGKISVLSN